MSKTKLYEELHSRMTQAKESGYYLESCWIAYAIIEDRINSTIRHAYPQNGVQLLESYQGLGRKMDIVKDRIHPRDHDCLKTINKNLLGDLDDWKSDRNDLMHEIAEEASFQDVQSKTRRLAREGVKLADRFASSVRKYKTKVRKRE